MAPATAPAWWCAPDANGPFDNNHLDTFVTECQKHIALQDAMPDRIPKLKKVLIGPVSIYYTGDGAKLACVTCTIIERVYIVQFDPYMGTADQWMAAMLGVCVEMAQAGVYHGDIHVGNLVNTHHDGPKLLDVGLESCVRGGADDSRPTACNSATRYGLNKSHSFLAPEVCN